MEMFYAVTKDKAELIGYDEYISESGCECCSDEMMRDYTSVCPGEPVAMFASETNLTYALQRSFKEEYVVKSVDL